MFQTGVTMSILRLVRRVPADSGAPVAIGSSLEIRALGQPPTGPELAAVGRFASESALEPGLSPRGALSALAARQGRSIRCWVAHRSATLEPVLGAVVLVVTGGGESCRASISWLLVRPQARRQGIGAALVATAVDHARSLGAREVWAETGADWPTVGFWAAAGFAAAAPVRTPLL